MYRLYPICKSLTGTVVCPSYPLPWRPFDRVLPLYNLSSVSFFGRIPVYQFSHVICISRFIQIIGTLGWKRNIVLGSQGMKTFKIILILLIIGYSQKYTYTCITDFESSTRPATKITCLDKRTSRFFMPRCYCPLS